MTKQDAWILIDNVCAQVNVNRESHRRIIEALNLLKPEGDNNAGS